MTNNDVCATPKIYNSRNHHKFRRETEWIIRHAIVSHGDVLCLEKNRFIVSRDFIAKYAMWLTIFINRFKHGHNVFRGNIWHDIVDGVKHKSASWSQNLNVAANIFLDLLGRPAI